jgi:hypothetical protein
LQEADSDSESDSEWKSWCDALWFLQYIISLLCLPTFRVYDNATLMW